MLTVTEKERSFLMNMRFSHAAKRKPPVKRKNSGRTAFICIAAAVLALSYCGQAFSEKLLESVVKAAEWSAVLSLYPITELVNIRMEMPLVKEKNAEDKAVDNEVISPSDIMENDTLMLSGVSHMPSSANEEMWVEDLLPVPDSISPITGNESPLPYPDEMRENGGRITELTYTSGKGSNYIDLPMGGQIRNVTSLSSSEIYKNATEQPDFEIKLNAPEDEPQILIMHTHTTESYEPYERDNYDEDYLCRTTDNEKNMTAVGRAMAEVFEKNGIRTIHSEKIHDYPSYNGSYDRSRETVKELLEKYPSIKVVLDVHRDAIEKADGERIAPTAEINGKKAAQIMIICGCDDGTMGMPDCMKNLRTAALFQQYMESMYPTLTRPMLYDYRFYNQDLTTGSLLIEVGGHANTLDQAIYAGELAAEGISRALKNENPS